jgi:hypothetical protein
VKNRQKLIDGQEKLEQSLPTSSNKDCELRQKLVKKSQQ